jgi:hypothetical protein
MEFNYIKGNKEDFYDAPSWATLKTACNDNEEYQFFIEKSEVGFKFCMHTKYGNGETGTINSLPEDVHVIAHRELINNEKFGYDLDIEKL